VESEARLKTIRAGLMEVLGPASPGATGSASKDNDEATAAE
jgi:hypothetical protein